jgi:hypothetical protein
MKQPIDILTDIKNGTPYTYNANLTKGRKFTIYMNNKGDLFLRSNQLKGQNRLSEKEALDIINNDINAE